MDDFIRQFTASQVRGALIGNAVCGPLVSFLTNLRCRDLPLGQAVADGVVTAAAAAFIVALGSAFVFRAGCGKNPWFKVEDHPLGECGSLMPLLPRSFWGIGAVFAVTGGALCALLLYLIFSCCRCETLPFGVFLIFKAVYPAIVGAVTARFAALNNFRYR